LCVAIPAYVAHRYLRGRVDGIVIEIEKDVIRFADALNDRSEQAQETGSA
jgi:biopolymer transport protein ExbB/TolQ